MENLIFTTINVKENDGLSFDAIPTYKFYPANNKSPVEFKGPFTVRHFIDFIRQTLASLKIKFDWEGLDAYKSINNKKEKLEKKKKKGDNNLDGSF